MPSKGTLHPSYERIYDYCLVIVENNGYLVMVIKDWAIYECENPFLVLKVWSNLPIDIFILHLLLSLNIFVMSQRMLLM